jgi:hypothetical protein
LLAQEAPRKLFRALVSMGSKHRTEHKMMWSKAVLDKLLPLECTRRSVCRYTPILHKEELEEAMDAIATHEKLAPLGKVELRLSAQSRSTPEQ